MATNFSVAETAVQDYIRGGGIEVTRYRRMQSAVQQAVIQSGGRNFANLAPVPTTIPVKSGQTDIGATAESQTGGSNSLPTSARVMEGRNLLVAAHGEVEKLTDQGLKAQLFGASTAQGYGPQLVAEKTPAIYSGFDAAHLTPLLTGATSVEYAGDAIAAIDTALAPYDEAAYNGDAMIVTRKGQRVFGLATDSQNRLQFNGDLANALPFDGPILRADITSADVGESNLLAVIGPFASCAVGSAGATEVKVFDQLEPTAGGAQENIFSLLVQRYLGFVAPSTSVIPATGWVKIVDDV